MNRIVLLSLAAAAGLAFAQTQPPSGGWRRVENPPPPPPAASAPVPGPQAQNPEPVDRSDAYGQPVQTAPDQQPEQAPDQAPPPPQNMPPAASRRPAYGLPAELTIQPGTYLTVRIAQTLSTDHNQPGDAFAAQLAQSVVVDGVVVAQRGQTVYGHVVDVQRQSSSQPSRMALELTSLTLADGTQAPIRSQLISRTGTSTPAGVQAGTVAATTGIGTMVGGAVGWGTGAAIGAGAGAAAGIAGVLLTRHHATVVYPETVLTFGVQSPVTVSTLRAPQAFRFVGPEEYNQPYNAELQPRPRPVPRVVYAPYPYMYPYPYAYAPYPYWGWGPGFGVGVGFWGRGGYYRRWR